MEKIGKIDERLQFIKIDGPVREVIRSLQPFLKQELPGALDELYAQIKAFPDTNRLFADGDRMARAHQAQLRHWSLIGAAAFDERYVNAAHANGEVHARVGLEPRWYIAGYAVLLEPLIYALIQQSWPAAWGFGAKDAKRGQETAQALSALVKCVMLDMDLVISTYFEVAETARRKAEQDIIEAERAMVKASIGSALRELAGKDLRYRLKAQVPDAYLELQGDFNTALQQLEAAIVHVGSCAETIKSSTEEISTAADDLSKRTEQQAASLEETAAALEEITATVSSTAQGAARATEIVSAAKSDAEKGHEVVRLAERAMTRIEKSSQEIAQIIGVIDEIAFQTNLLALNAGVEAARAGQAGKGFAVVASEVRALAQRSAQAAKEIKNLIASSTREVGQGVELVAQTGAALEEIVVKVNKVDQVVGDIAAGAREQATGLSEVNVAIGQMDQATQRNAAMVEETTAATRGLRLEMDALMNAIAHFRVNRSAATSEAGGKAAAPPRSLLKMVAGGSPPQAS